MSRKQPDNEKHNLYKPKAITYKKSDRSKTAPIDTFINLDEIQTEGDNNEYIASYNYYIYYHSLKPKDPRLPKPLYKPMPDIDFIKKGNRVENIILENNDDERSYKANSHDKDSYNMHRINEEADESGLDTMMSNLNITNKPNRSMMDNEFNQSYFDYMQNTVSGKPQPTYGGNKVLNYDNFNDYNKRQNFELPYSNIPQGNFQKNSKSGLDFNYYEQSGMSTNPYMGGSSSSQFSQYNQMGNFNNNTPNFNNYYGMGMGNNNLPNMGNMNNLNNMSNTYPYNISGGNNNFYSGNSNNNPYYSQYGGGFKNNPGNSYNNPSMDNSFHSQYNQYVEQPNMMGRSNNLSNNNNYGYMGEVVTNNNNNYSKKKHHSNNNNNNNVMNNFSGSGMGIMNNSMSGGNTFPNFGNYSNLNPNSNPKKGYGMEVPNFDDILENIIQLSKDHSGSRLVQRKFEESNELDREKIFERLLPEIYNLTKDVFGNYVIQKILEYSTPENRRIIILELEGKVYELTLHMYGCRVIQKAIEVAEVDLVRKHLKELKNHIKNCIEDQNGNHVIQKLIEKLPNGEHNEIIKVINGKTYELSTHQYGCRVIQRVFEFCDDKEKEKILCEIYERINELCVDQYGNYVIQHIIEKMGSQKITSIYEELRGRIFEMSIHKFASNVVEKCLAYGNISQKNEIISEIILKDDETSESLLAMVKDKYGNYVVQKMIEVASNNIKDLIIKRIISSQSLKKRDGFSKHVINFIERMGFSANSLK